MNKKADEDNNMTTKENSAENPMPGSDKDFAPFPNSILPHITPDDNSDGVSPQSYTSNTTDAHNSIETKLLWRMLQVPGFTKAMIADIRGEWVMLYSHMNGVPMRLYRKVADVAAWLGVELAPALPVFAPGDVVTVREAYNNRLWEQYTLDYQFLTRSERILKIEVNPDSVYAYQVFTGGLYSGEWGELPNTDLFVTGILNGTDTLEVEAVDPVVIDEPTIDPDDTEIMPCPDVAEWEDLRGLNVTPWVSAGETDFTEPQDELPLLNNLHWLGKDDAGFNITRKDGKFVLSGTFNATQLNAFWQDWHGGIKEPLAEKQAVEKWLDERFIPYSVLDPVTGFPRTLSLIERLEQSERWLIEELVTARNQLEALRANARQDASQAPTTSAAGKSNPDISAHQTGLIYGDEAA